jgi:hypothetical protein
MASTPALPSLPTPVTMPTPNNPGQQATLTQQMQQQYGQTGRQATNLDPTNAGTRKPAGGTYTGTWLGA